MIFFPILAAASIACHAVDGDTLRCGGERIRLIGIDAPEMPGHCAAGRHCAPGDPWASKAGLASALESGPVRIDRIGRDHYGRTLAVVYAGRVNLACAQLDRGFAVYKPWWDNGGRIARECRRR